MIGTAGHVDHGKTTLIQALTGHDTDRLPEEKKRGISIDLGFAPFRLPSGRRAAIVDVPGHERFIRNMLAGVSGIDLVLLVVAADEGVMPQTREHLDILQLLDLQHGIVVLTKVDLCDEDWLELVEADIGEALSGTFLQDAPLFRVSAVSGAGIANLTAFLDRFCETVPPRPDAGPVRLPIDRVFSVAGFGTVVTGTIVSGRMKLEDRLVLYPEGHAARVRGLQMHGEAVDSVRAGSRAAVNLSGVEREHIHRGQVLAEPQSVVSTQTASVALRLLPQVAEIRNNTRVHVHTGTAEAVGRIVLLAGDRLGGGDRAYARLRLESPLALGQGDRFIIRRFSPLETLGGGRIVDPRGGQRRFDETGLEDLRRRESGSSTERVVAALQVLELATVSEVSAQSGLGRQEVEQGLHELGEAQQALEVAPGVYVAAVWLRQRLAAIGAALDDYHRRYPLRAGLSREEVRRRFTPKADARLFSALVEAMCREGGIASTGDVLCREGFTPVLDVEAQKVADEIRRRLREGRLQPPVGVELVAGLARDLAQEVLGYLTARGEAVRAQDIVFDAQAVASARERVLGRLREAGTLGMSELRDLLGTSRKYAVPLAEHFDEEHVTLRVGDTRVLGRPASAGDDERRGS